MWRYPFLSMVLLCVGLALAASWEPNFSNVSLTVEEGGCRYGQCQTSGWLLWRRTACSRRIRLACGESREASGGLVVQCGCTPPGGAVRQGNDMRFVPCGTKARFGHDSVSCHCS